MSDRELVVYIAGQVEEIVDMCQGLLSDRLNDLSKRLDHADTRAHEIAQKVDAIHADLEKYRPLLERYADPGKAIRERLFGQTAAQRKGHQ